MRGWLPVLARVLEQTLVVAGVALVLHGLWELAQLACYQFTGTEGRVAFLVKRLRADIGLSALGYLLACVVLRDSGWLWHRLRAGVIVMAVFGSVFAVVREWLATHAGAAVYAEFCAQVLGFALPPLLQWLIVPVLLARLTAPLLRRPRA
jgi:hypothetical protein